MARTIRAAAARLRAPPPRLHPDWRRTARRAWSPRLILLAALLEFANVVCQAVMAHPPVWWFSIIAALVSMGALVARFLAQKSLQDQTKGPRK